MESITLVDSIEEPVFFHPKRLTMIKQARELAVIIGAANPIFVKSGGQSHLFSVQYDGKACVMKVTEAQYWPEQPCREARLLQRLSACVPTVYAHERHGSSPLRSGHSGIPLEYIIMEVVTPLSSVIEDSIHPGTAIEIGRQLTGILAHIHDEGVEHRDVKPENIGITNHANPRIVMYDLGSALERGEETTLFSGTMGYLAPEILALRKKLPREIESDPDARDEGIQSFFGSCDQFSTAATIDRFIRGYCVISSRKWQEDNKPGHEYRALAKLLYKEYGRDVTLYPIIRQLREVAELVDNKQQIMNGDIPPLADIDRFKGNHRVGALSDILLKAMQARPRERYSDMVQFHNALSDVGERYFR